MKLSIQSQEKIERDSSFGLHISQINRVAQSYFTRKLKPLGIGPGEQAYLLSLFPREEIIQEELVKRLRVDRANVTRAVHSLEKKGLLIRSTVENDGRKRYIRLSEEGVFVRGEVEKISQQWIERLKEPLTPKEWSRLAELLAAVSDSLSD